MGKEVPLAEGDIRLIKASRALLDWSQEDLARESGLSSHTIKRIEAFEEKKGAAKYRPRQGRIVYVREETLAAIMQSINRASHDLSSRPATLALVVDPTSGTGGFLLAAAESLRRNSMRDVDQPD